MAPRHAPPGVGGRRRAHPTIGLLGILLLAVAAALLLPRRPLAAQECPKPAAASPRPRIEVHIFQPSCDAPLLSGKRAVVRVWAMWVEDPEASETDPEFPARITVRDGGGNVVVTGTTLFKRFPWEDLETRKAQHTWEFVFTPRNGVTRSPLSVAIEPLREGDTNVFPDPGVRPFAFEEGNPERADGRRILKVNYVIPLIGPWAGGSYGDATDWLAKNGAAAEEFLVQNLPVHDVKRMGVHPVDVSGLLGLSDTEPGPCLTNPNATCVSYTRGPNEQVENWLARQFADLADESIVVVLIPPGYAGDLFRGKTIFFDPGEQIRAVLSSADFTTPDFPVIVIPVSVQAWVLAHEMGHVFRGLGHVEAGRTKVRNPETGEVRETALSEGIHAFKVPLTGRDLSLNKHSQEGNGEDLVLEPLMKEGPSRRGLRRRFVSDAVYRDLLAGVRDMGSDIWASASRPVAADAPSRASAHAVRPERPSSAEPYRHGLPPPAPQAVEPPPGAPVSLRRSRAPEAAGTPVPTSSVQRSGAVPHLLLRGSIGPDGEVILDPLAVSRVGPTTVEAGEGPYRVEVRAASGEVLQSRAFGPAPGVVEEDESRIDEGPSFFVAVPWSTEAQEVVVLDAAGAERASVAKPAGAPALSVDFEDVDEDSDRATARVEWSLSGATGEETVDLLYSPDGESEWSSVARGLEGGSTTLSTGGLRRGPKPTLRLSATDGFRWDSRDRELDLERFDAWSVYPAPGDTTSTGEVWALVSSDLDPDEIGTDALALEDARGMRIDGEIGYDPDASRLWFVPDEPLAPGLDYRARLSDDLRDRWGGRLRQSVEWTFRTAPDTLGPRVVAAEPWQGDITVPPTVQPSVTFDEPLAEPPEGALRLETATGTAVAGDTRYEPELKRLVFQPGAELEQRTGYRLVVSPDVHDAAGNPVGEVAPILFTTAGRIVVGGGR